MGRRSNRGRNIGGEGEGGRGRGGEGEGEVNFAIDYFLTLFKYFQPRE